ncbi:hypothetical protein SNEBB_009702 [Seison nebaliae]|nr:hypothetical protein SNEBB_009702 [Seison nebaliae]
MNNFFVNLLVFACAFQIGWTGKSCGKRCPKILSPVCGSNGKSYTNNCILEIAQCENGSITKKHNGLCGSQVNQATEPVTSECNKNCSDNVRPICGSDGRSYQNKCEFKNAKCRNPSLTKKSDGNCMVPY